jgi:hypothetical protein
MPKTLDILIGATTVVHAVQHGSNRSCASAQRVVVCGHRAQLLLDRCKEHPQVHDGSGYRKPINNISECSLFFSSP